MTKGNKLYAVFKFKCPHCHEGEFFVDRNPYHLSTVGDLHETCSVCHRKYTPEPGFYYGGMYGGSTTSILINTPGEAGSMMTALEGNRMAKSGRTAMEFLETLRGKTQVYFEAETAQLLAFRRSLEGESAPEIQPWDLGYYAEKERAAKYSFDEEALRPYLPAEGVLREKATAADQTRLADVYLARLNEVAADGAAQEKQA